MKRFIVLAYFLAIVALGMPGVALGGHTVSSISPASASPGTTISATITGTGFDCTAVGGCPFVQLVAASVPVIVGTSVTLVSATTTTATFTIPAAAPLGSRNLEVIAGPGPGTHTATLTSAFTVGSGGGGAGGGFIEAVPTKFGGIPTGPQTGAEFISVVEGITDWIFVVLLVMAVVFIVLAAFQFIAGGGDPQAVAQARNKLIWAAVGIVVALLARGIPAAIGNLMGA